jgi:hypothetical protein
MSEVKTNLGCSEYKISSLLAPSCPWSLKPQAKHAPDAKTNTEWSNPHATVETTTGEAKDSGQTQTKVGGTASSGKSSRLPQQ